ncbi:hypothetical protein [Variovorax sp. UMC13]|uniref:hypothetical protein n=1 Tax=Variovorax sp. UMC13 TaxID=1862326 RepID=UPI001602452B|nr:hypothetical protein [Variovorax sp. UMC13]
MEPIIDFLKRRLREVGPSRWEAVALAAGIAKTLPRKIAYEDRGNPGVQTVQPLLDYFNALDRGEVPLPVPVSAREMPKPADLAGQGP